MTVRILFLLVLLGRASVAQPILEAISKDASSWILRVPTSAETLFVLDQASSLSSNWTEAAVFSGTGAAREFTNDFAGPQRYFRTRAFPATLVSKPGAATVARLALSNSPVLWTVEGELPEGLSFAAGVFSGTATPLAAEVSAGLYTNVIHLEIPAAGEQPSRLSSAEFVHKVKLSFSRNIYPDRPNGPSLGSICLKCHGSGFPPDFSPSASTLIGANSGSGGSCPNTWDYIVPGHPESSLVYMKVVAPPCGDRMPQGGPYFNQAQIDRLARWISELGPGETD